MENLEKYKQYYFLENYLFDTVTKNFERNRHLTEEEFFAIVIWKSNRAKTKVRDGIKESQKTVQMITSEISQAKTPEEKLKLLTDIDGIGLPMASAILTVCYPKDFTVVDYRARSSLKEFDVEIKGDPSTDCTAYFDYLNKCMKLAQKFNFSLRDFDRILWAKDFCEGKEGLKDLVKSLTTQKAPVPLAWSAPGK